MSDEKLFKDIDAILRNAETDNSILDIIQLIRQHDRERLREAAKKYAPCYKRVIDKIIEEI